MLLPRASTREETATGVARVSTLYAAALGAGSGVLLQHQRDGGPHPRHVKLSHETPFKRLGHLYDASVHGEGLAQGPDDAHQSCTPTVSDVSALFMPVSRGIHARKTGWMRLW